MVFLTRKTFLLNSNLLFFFIKNVNAVNILLPRHLEVAPYLSFRESETTLVVVTEVSVEIAGDRLSLILTVLVP